MGAIMAEKTLGSLKNPPTNVKCTLLLDYKNQMVINNQ